MAKRRGARDDDRFVERLGLDLPLGLWYRRPRRRPERAAPKIECSGDIPSISFLVSTSTYGVVSFSGARASLIESPRWSYGLARLASDWIVFGADGHRGRLEILKTDQPGCPKSLAYGLPPRIHQIEVLGDDLLLTDPYNNRLLVYDLDGHHRARYWRTGTTSIYPAGKAVAGRSSPNYAHFNSVFTADGAVYVIAHNDFNRSCRLSELWILTPTFEVAERRSLGQANCHNYFRSDEMEVFLASNAGQVFVNGEIAADLAPQYLRGLAVSREAVLVGGSQKSQRPERARGAGHVTVFSRSMVKLGEIRIAGTQIHDIRLA